MKPVTSPSILTIVVTYNSLRFLEKCIGSLHSSAMPTDILAVDNASEDGSLQWLRANGVETVSCEENLGFGAANNIGLRIAVERGYSFVYLCNADAWVEESTLGSLVAAFQTHPEYGLLSPLQMRGDLTGMDAQFERHCGRSVRSCRSDIAEVEFVMAAHWMLSMRCIQLVGGFSPAFRHYGEDWNYAARVRWHGLKAGVLVCARAVHDRDDRPRPKAYRMNLKKTAAVAEIVAPQHRFTVQTVLQPVLLAAMSVRHLSLKPLMAIPSLIRDYPRLYRLRKESLLEGAFLQ